MRPIDPTRLPAAGDWTILPADVPGDPMQIKPAQRHYWRKNLQLTFALLLAWFVITFVGGYYAATLNEVSFMGFPLGFYLLAQGALLAYLIIIAIYVRTMNRRDREWGLEAAHHEPGLPPEPEPRDPS